MSVDEALQSTLAGEHAAVWTYALLGARTSRTAQRGLYDALLEAHEVHRSRRAHLQRRIRDRGQEPGAAEPGYRVPRGVSRPDRARATARDVEERCATAYAWQVANATGEDRAWAVAALTDAAARQLVFRGIPENFPGLDELAGH